MDLPLVNPLDPTPVAPDLEDECGGTALPIQFEQQSGRRPAQGELSFGAGHQLDLR